VSCQSSTERVEGLPHAGLHTLGSTFGDLRYLGIRATIKVRQLDDVTLVVWKICQRVTNGRRINRSRAVHPTSVPRFEAGSRRGLG